MFGPILAVTAAHLAALSLSPAIPPKGVALEPREPIATTSTNWAGYALPAVPDRTYRRVSAVWTQPTATCDEADSYVSIWVGLDGDGNDTVEQTGTQVNCVSGEPVLSAWIEMYPNWPLEIPLSLRPGDRIVASVAYLGGYRYRLSLRDLTTRSGFVRTPRSTVADRASAEAIIEAPSSLFAVLPLANFGTVTVERVTVDGLPLGSRVAAERIAMTDERGNLKARTSLVDPSTFTVDWLAP